MGEEQANAKETLNERFTDFADRVSTGMGTPLNILIWLLAVMAWFLLFALIPDIANSHFLPAWFTSNSFNFPLNTVTTLAELYIGFLVAAATNRVERRHDALLQEIKSHAGAARAGTDQDIETTERAKMDIEALKADIAAIKEVLIP